MNILLNKSGKFIIAAHIARLHVRAFDPGKGQWKMTADGKFIEMKDGNPVLITGETESVVAVDTITRLNGEAKQHRLRAEKAEADLKVFEGVDAKAAKSAIDIVSKLDQKKLIDAGEVDKVREEISKNFTTQLNELKTVNQTITGELDALRINTTFAQSEFIRNEIAMPRDFFEAAFRPNFKIKDGKVEAYDKSGNRIYSKKNAGEFADPEEALQILVDQHPQKTTILKAPGHSGSGNNGDGGNRGGGRTIKRSEFEGLAPNVQAAKAQEMREGKLAIID